MTNHEKIRMITRTAIFVALLITVQSLSRPLGQYVTGSLVNFLLIVATMTGGLSCGAAVALISPLMAFFLGIGIPLPPIVPIVMLGNLSLVSVWSLFVGRSEYSLKKIWCILAMCIGAGVKFAVLYAGVVKLAIPYILTLSDKQAAALTLVFSFPQLITAVIGGCLAMAVLPALKKALRSS